MHKKLLVSGGVPRGKKGLPSQSLLRAGPYANAPLFNETRDRRNTRNVTSKEVRSIVTTECRSVPVKREVRSKLNPEILEKKWSGIPEIPSDRLQT